MSQDMKTWRKMNKDLFFRKSIFSSIVVVVGLVLSLSAFSEAVEPQEDMEAYLRNISSIITDINITVTNIGLNTFPIKEGIKRLDNYIGQLEFIIDCPEGASTQHKMILLSFKKLRMGLLLLSPETKDTSIRLIKSGTRLLKYAAADIIKIARECGMMEEKDEIGKKEGGE